MSVRNAHRLAVVLLALIGSMTLGWGDQGTDTTEGRVPTKTLRVISYNVQFLPAPVSFANKRKQPEYRARQIGDAMSKFDIVGLNEVFDERYHKIIIERLEAAWGDRLNVLVSPKPEGRFNGGCMIASRLPFVETHTMIYENFSSPKEYGIMADGFAAKGAIHARIARGPELDSDTIDVFVTHLEARAPDIREKQYPELAAFIRKYSDPDRPTLILGDMNTRGNREYQLDPDSRYARFMNILGTARDGGVTDLWPELMGEAHGGTSEQESSETGNRIDYVMVSNPQAPAPALRGVSIRVNGFLDPEVVALSDHSAVEAVLEWTPKDSAARHED